MRSLPVVAFLTTAAWSFAGLAQDAVVSKPADRSALSVTIYNNGIGLVRETRRVQLPKAGRVQLDFLSVAPTIRAPSVSFSAIDDPRSVAVIEQSYRYDVLDPQTLTKRAAGLPVSLHRVHPGTGEIVRTTGQALADFTGMTPVLRTQEGVTYYGGVASLGFGALPERWVSEPMLSWQLDVRRAGARDLGVSYLASGMSWSADYLLVLGKGNEPGTLVGWITLENRSGASFDNAHLAVVAGKVNLVRPDLGLLRETAPARSMKKSAPEAPVATRSSLSEYHLYDIPNTSSLPDQSSKQVTFLVSNALRPKTRYVADDNLWWRMNDPQNGSTTTDSARVELRFDAKEDQGLGVPMPAGMVRVFSQDSRGQGQLVGEASIDHTPRDETVKLRIGAAADVRLVRKLVDRSRLGRLNKDMVSYQLRNAKSEEVEVEVIERAGKLDHATVPATHPDAKTTLFTVRVPANGAVSWQAEYTEGWE
jgi:hypothetical protein